MIERGRLALRMEEPELAERWLRRATKQNPNHSEACLALQLALQSQGRVEAELNRRVDQNAAHQAELKERLNKKPGEPSVLTEVGNWMLRIGNEEEVLGWLYGAIRRDATFAPGHEGLASYFQEKGLNRRAARHASEAGIRLTPVKASPKVNSRSATQEPRVAFDVTKSLAGNHEASFEEVQRLCAACHAYPPPETMPRDAWRKEVRQGFDFLHHSRLGGQYPSFESVALYYERRASDRLVSPPPRDKPLDNPFPFEKRGTGYIPRLPPSPGITHANLARLLGGKELELLLCDTRQDALLILKPYQSGPGGTILPEVPSPCHTTVCDLNGDGIQDILVASIGSFFPTDDRLGKVLWLRGKAQGQFDVVELLSGVGRVTDIQPADFNGDGKMDLVVAVFGWRMTGEIRYLENHTTDWSRPEFANHVVDDRHGAIHVPVADFNGDGLPDFAALLSQEHEKVVAFLNRGEARFEQATIYAAPHPGYGSSGIELVDLDADSDVDILMTNGDILDPPYLLKPDHGVQWLENQGSFPFQRHTLASMHGASRAISADFDADGDQDVLAVSFLPARLFPEREQRKLPSVLMIEQRAKGSSQAMCSKREPVIITPVPPEIGMRTGSSILLSHIFLGADLPP